MTIKTLEHIHNLLQEDVKRADAERITAGKEEAKLAKYYDVVRGQAYEHEAEWKAGGKEDYEAKLIAAQAASKVYSLSLECLRDFESQEF